MISNNNRMHPMVYDAKEEQIRDQRYRRRLYISLIVWFVITLVTILLRYTTPSVFFSSEAKNIFEVIAITGWIFTMMTLFKLANYKAMVERGRPTVESRMIGRLFDVVAWFVAILVILNSFGKLTALSAIFAAFGGMFLGWALQAPVSGLAAWILVSLKRPFRPGDRILFSSLGLVGDVKEIGVMYTILDQVGGSVGSEEAVGRYILVPNAMLFGQVVINYTVQQKSPYILDEVVVRITYDSDWDIAEQILIQAATEITKPIIEVTGQKPYIRLDMYDYGVYMRLRYMTSVLDRAKIATDITKEIYHKIQKTNKVDLAIPFIYSYRTAMETKDAKRRSTVLKTSPLSDISSDTPSV